MAAFVEKNIFGDIEEVALERLHRKADLLGKGRVEVNGLHTGFAR